MLTLDAISRGEASLDEASDIIHEAIKSEVSSAAIYKALAEWTWVTLSSRRFDDELRHWHSLLNNTSHFIKHRGIPDDEKFSERINTLADLIKASIFTSAQREAITGDMKTIIMVIATFLEDDVSKTAISLASGFSSAHLSRVLMSLVVRGILNSRRAGSEEFFSISKDHIRTI